MRTKDAEVVVYGAGWAFQVESRVFLIFFNFDHDF
jgi:hypothetical protein